MGIEECCFIFIGEDLITYNFRLFIRFYSPKNGDTLRNAATSDHI